MLSELEETIEVELEIGELFERMETLKSMKFANTDEYIIPVEDVFQIKDEHNDWIDVTGLVTKEDSTITLYFDNLSSQTYAKKHLLSYDRLHTKFVDEYVVGDMILDASKNKHIITHITFNDRSQKLYDLQVQSDTHLFQSANGLVHHNSVGLINLSWNYVKMGKDVIYISLELKEEKIMKRYICHSAGIPVKNIPDSEMEIYNHLKKCDARGYGRFTTHFYQPNTLSAMKLELFVRNYVQMYGVVPIIILDYAGLMTPNGKTWQGMFEKDKYVSEELRGVATLFDTVVWTADQFNRSIFIDEKVQTDRGIINFGDITTEDRVLTHSKRMAPVRTVHDKQDQECYEITLKSGKRIICSGKHMFPKVDPRKEHTLFNEKIIDNINTSLKVGDNLWTMDEEEEAYYQTQIKSEYKRTAV